LDNSSCGQLITTSVITTHKIGGKKLGPIEYIIAKKKKKFKGALPSCGPLIWPKAASTMFTLFLPF
jgi:hypothetical protein